MEEGKGCRAEGKEGGKGEGRRGGAEGGCCSSSDVLPGGGSNRSLKWDVSSVYGLIVTCRQRGVSSSCSTATIHSFRGGCPQGFGGSGWEGE